MKDFQNCPCCKAKIKSGMFNSVYILSEDQIKIINTNQEVKHEAYCTKCGISLLQHAKESIESKKSDIEKNIFHLIQNLPIITSHSPYNWKYKVLGLVTGQSTTGTGVITEFTSSFTDFFGAQSKRHNTKVKKGEDLCMAQLRSQAYDMGANAIIATDIDYSEMGAGSKGMILVCMSGTAVKIENIKEVFTEDLEQKFNQIEDLNKEYSYLEQLSKIN